MAIVDLNQFSGVNTNNDRAKIDDVELASCINFDVTDKKYLRKRPGCLELIGILTDPIRVRGYYLNESSNLEQLAYTTGDNTYVIEPLGVGAGASVGGYVPKDTFQYSGILWAISSTGGLSKWDGATFSNVIGPPNGTQILVYKDRMFLINSTGASGVENRLYYSNFYVTGDVTTEQFKSASWSTSTQYIGVGEGDGDKIVAIKEFNDIIYIFKHFSTWVLYAQSGSPTAWVLKRISNNNGCLSKNTLQEIDGLLYFESPLGIYRTDGISFEEISAPIRNSFSGRTIDASSYDDDSSAYWSTKYMICIFDRISGNKKSYVFDTINSSWTEYQWRDGLLNPRTAVNMRKRNGSSPVAFADGSGSGRIYQFGTPTQLNDDGVAFTASLKTKLFDLDQPFEMKKCNRALMTFKASGVSPSYGWYHDDGSLLGGTLNSAVGGSISVDQESRTIKGPGYFRAVSFYFSDGGAAAGSSFHGLSLDVHEKSRPRRNTPQ